MRILVLGAGALGGYFGGRLQQAGAEVAYVVRPRRREQLARDGLMIASPFGDAQMPATTLLAGEVGPGWDVILLTCKAYDLDDAIATIRPAVDARTAVLPVLNGLAHIATLQGEFGADRVLGGLAKIQATLTPAGVVTQMNDWRWLTFGETDGRMSPRVEALAALGAQATGMVATAVPDILQRMWEKLVHLGTSAIGTVLMRANTGEIARSPGGVDFMHRVLERNAAIAAAQGHPMLDGFLAEYRALFADPAAGYATSMLRDLEAGGRIEADHILGFLLQAARAAGLPTEIHEAAFLHAKAYEQRRDAGRLPRG
ncbi:ketopantoate reductase family protein [Paracraurococcus ruber]|uniref:2-dehydropantoate 2-reductase n=1 Tax=Paracraurococcus ruber TaxID=77675 RepID=A0ABS1D095_9PROT|nr:ketopantoate reductase family protein [Paracraurococcus ruber]MBK1659901.1 2-dehydropantoate 2-reductase [Paracraurococcus ruber]TDG30968.1 ketopantoate reductase family protein [Paracraurococcus ruber]